ncbi:membrane metallo-endopeptidase-like 1, partial [Stegodyphus dumicola]|uniref:membrane metallo-endopeptidase-like 1 n=1 Tax=Stegodyphus dumicola TaxID=202533 RepID=UPI0015AFA3D3
MYGLMNVELLMKFLCISSFDNKHLNFVPDLCTLDETIHEISQRRDTSASEHCLENGCFTKDSGKLTSMLVDTDVLMSLMRNYSNCNVCLTDQCYKDATEILSSLDEDVDPCDDFYQFACGGWLKRHTIPKEKSYVSVYSKLEDDIQLQLKSLLEKATENDPEYIRMIKGIYQSCMDSESLNKAGSEPLKKVLKDLGGWPVIEGDNWNPQSFDWIDTLIKLRTKGFNHDILIGLSLVKDPYDSTNHVIKLDQPSLGLHYDYLQDNLNNNEKSDYFDLMLQAAYVLSTNDISLLEFSSTNIDVFSKSLSEALNFEIGLSKLVFPGKFREKYTVQKLMDEARQAQSMELHVSYPDLLRNDSFIAKRYENLKLTNESYFDKAMKVRKWSTDNFLSQLRKTSQNYWISVYRWSTKGQVKNLIELQVDIFPEYPNGSSAQIIYYYSSNRLDLPAGILQQAFSNRGRLHSLNWGALGFKIAQEMSQAFLNEGRFYDKDGNKVNWWRPHVQLRFEGISNCFINQYGGYIEDDYGLNLE